MLASTRRNHETRRGIVLVLILGMLGLMAVIGITFATFTGQSRISARNFAQSVNQPQRDELMDFALSQLIMDTNDVRSAIRGHSMARDMFGNDAFFNGYLTQRPDGASTAPNNNALFYITNTATVTGSNPPQFDLLTNIPIPANDHTFFGYNFTRWVMRVSYVGPVNTGNGKAVDQTLEILYDNMTINDTTTSFPPGSASNPNGYQVFRVTAIDMPLVLGTPTTLNNATYPTPGTVTATYQSMNQFENAGGFAAYSNLNNYPFILDGRWLHAFNGPGMTTAAVHANFRYNGPQAPFNLSVSNGNPNLVGMDEDYDAVDLENWFLAMQSADGSVMIPSFHRPAALRIDPHNATNPIYDWGGPFNKTWENAAVLNWSDSASRILRPRAADGHDASTFPDLLPDATGRITYDVDNDADGMTDSVWVDLGYPARRNSRGQLFKPLFAFMVIGLNGRIPLNTAGNLAGTHAGPGAGPAHAAHLGNSPSEIDPTYGLQNALDPTTTDVTNAFTPPTYPPTIPQFNTQVDNTGTDVRLTQLRNILAGTRPQPIPKPSVAAQFPWLTDPSGTTNGDNNFVLTNEGSQYYFMPNGVADTGPGSSDIPVTTPPPHVQRTTPPVPGRWGESQSVPGYPIPVTNGFVNYVGSMFNNHVRAGYSWDVGDLTNGQARDAADDNFNSFDPFPPGHTGEVGDSDNYDLSGALLLPVERMRRFVTPVDINGTGRVAQWNNTTTAGRGFGLGGDQWGRVQFFSYFRPPGLPGQVAPGAPGAAGTGVITFQWTNPPPPAAPPVYPADLNTDVGTPAPNHSHNNNPLHGFESYRFPNQVYTAAFPPQRAGGVPFDLHASTTNPAIPTALPTYDYQVNAHVNSDGLNEADEMNLYNPNALFDSPFGPSDLEWLYRQQDVDGSSLTSRLASLAPISFTNNVSIFSVNGNYADALRRRRLYSTDTWEMNNLIWANDNPGGSAFAFNSRFNANANAGFSTLHVPAATNSNMSLITNDPTFAAPSPTMSLAHRNKKINLNYPLPVSNDPSELIRQKWINDTYQTLKAILPPRSVDTPEELAQLSQFVINIVDFRDPDATMTHWTNPDVFFRPGSATVSPILVLTKNSVATDRPLRQWGMEFNPLAINEVLAYSFARKGGPTPRFYLELVNTLTSPESGTVTNNASILDLAGFLSATPAAATDPWAGACWDYIFTADDPLSRPDPYMGQLWSGGTFYGLTPFKAATFNPALTTDPVINPLPQSPPGTGATLANYYLNSGATPPPYFLTIGNPLPTQSDGSLSESKPYIPTWTLASTYDPVAGTPPGTPPDPGVLPVPPGPNPTPPPYPGVIPAPGLGAGTGSFYWICLRRPANPFAPVSARNPMLVVDSMRFPYIESGGTGKAVTGGDFVTQGTSRLYSYQRLQPYRGGQAVPGPMPAGAGGAGLDPRYGYSEQIAVPTTTRTNFGQYGTKASQTAGPPPSPGPNITTNPIYETLGLPNDGTLTIAGGKGTMVEPWDQLVFNDRDFSSVAELMLVPGCPPGLFTKQFAEFAPSSTSAASIFSMVTPQGTAAPVGAQMGGTAKLPASPATASAVFNGSGAPNPIQPHTSPFLVDKFFYTGAQPATVPPPPGAPALIGDQTGDGWFKMFEVFDIPSQMIGSIGPVMQGTNFDWMRQDTKPGLINPNLIIDEEVFLSVFGNQSSTFVQQLMNFDQLPPPAWQGGSWGYQGTASQVPLAVGSSPVPIVVTSRLAGGGPGSAYPMNNVGMVAPDPLSTVNPINNQMKVAFAQFLTLRHGGSGYVFGDGSGPTGVNTSIALTTPNPHAPYTVIPADRPFHSLGYPDIDYTVLRPAALPASPFSDPQQNLAPTAGQLYAGDPGVRNPLAYPGYASGAPGPSSKTTTPTWVPGPTTLQLPPAIPVRRLFQIPDFYPGTGTGSSNANEIGDTSLNNLMPTAVPGNPFTGALPPFNTAGGPVNANNSVANILWPSTYTTPGPGPGPYLGAGVSGAGAGLQDQRQHPYFRGEMLQKAVNLTTSRTHQYAVWVTVGFFEVRRQGDLLMVAAGAGTQNATLAYDILGPEVGASTGQTTRYRSFFIVDRLKLTAYDPNVIGSFRPAVIYRQAIE